MFSSRLPPRLDPNPVSHAFTQALRAGAHVIDLTETNPTAVGLLYPVATVAALAHPGAASYAPDPRGLLAARQAIRAEWPETAGRVPAEQIVLTPSTSDAYSLLFKLLCDAGTGVLVPQPSYPLFDLLTALDCVQARPYRLEYHGLWSIDRESLLAALTPDVRAILVVTPNNPTGSCLRTADRDWLVSLADASGLAIISDEVFSEYPLRRAPDAASFLGETRALTFTLGGLSKAVGLPQHKLAWILVSGPAAPVSEALERLDVIADSYLSVGTPVQLATAALLESGAPVRRAIQGRLGANLDLLRERAARVPALTLFEPEGGWSAVIRIPGHVSEEAVVLAALQAGVRVHPGYFFDFPHGAHLVVSLIVAPEVFTAGLSVLCDVIGEFVP